jgi:hypothetical protein
MPKKSPVNFLLHLYSFYIETNLNSFALSEDQSKLVAALLKKNPHLFRENKPVKLKISSTDESGKKISQVTEGRVVSYPDPESKVVKRTKEKKKQSKNPDKYYLQF